MITHIVLVQPKPEATQEELEAVFEQFRALPGKIPGLLSIQAGTNKHTVNQGYTYGFIMHFEDETSLRAYSPHPAHKAISPELRRLSNALLNFDLIDETTRQ